LLHGTQFAEILEEVELVRKNDTEVNQSMEKFIANGNCWELLPCSEPEMRAKLLPIRAVD
jgi:hypothetical protein